MSRWIGAVFLLGFLAGCSITPRPFQPADPIAPELVSHQAWDQIVQAHVLDGQVDYPAIQAGGKLDVYLGELNRIDPAKLPSRQHRLAFWINAYNAFAVKGIVDHYSQMTLWGRYRYIIDRDLMPRVREAMMIKKLPLAVRRMILLMTGMAFAESEAPVNHQRRRVIRACVGTKKGVRDNIQGARSS